MRSKAPLALMEQLVMVVVFALAAALCVRIFALSDRFSRECEIRDRAVSAVQNAAEALKACRGDYAEASGILGGRGRKPPTACWRCRRTAVMSCWVRRM